MTRDCAVPDCAREAQRRGWCWAHYDRWKRTGDVQAWKPIRTAHRPARPHIYHRRKAAGFCGSCGRARVDGHELCAPCRAVRRIADAKRHAANKAKGLCQCGSAPVPGKLCCQACIDRGMKSWRARRQEEA